MWYDTNFYVIRRINEEKKKVCNVMWCDFLCDMTIDPLFIGKKTEFSKRQDFCHLLKFYTWYHSIRLTTVKSK